ncbi:sensor histidine kinase [Sphaerotilus microaerophilus]|uniref:sensor histidine kinase n=1 Tax=Sphaerotilus microaerophilus TaxID=2914710 RepID=UPI0020743046|nr:sensor histidine kinase [Sphaerotilus sp. FB-5]
MRLAVLVPLPPSRRPRLARWCSGWASTSVLALALVLALAGVLTRSAQAAPVGPPILALSTVEAYSPRALLPFLGSHVDHGARWRIDDARAQPQAFQLLEEVFSGGYRRDRAFWFRLQLDASDSTTLIWWLRLHSAYLDDVQLWHFGPDGRLIGGLRRAGDLVELQGAQELPAPTFALDLTAPGVHEVYLRVHTASSALIPVSLMGQPAAERSLPQELLLISMLLGASFIMFAVACGAAVWLRDRLYVLYAVFVLANSLTWVGISGFAHLLWFDLQPPWSDRMTASAIALSASVGPYLYVRLLALADLSRRAFRLSQAGALLLAAAAILPWLGWNSHWTPWVLVLLTALQVLVVIIVFRQWPRMAAGERMLALPVLCLALLTTVNTLLTFGVVKPSGLALAAGPFAHVMHLTVLIWFLFRQTRAARHAATESEKRALAAELRQRLEAEAREDNANLIAMLAHEIRTPVAVIDAALQSLQMLDEQPTPERALRHDRIGRALNRLTQLVDLAMARDRLDVAQWSESQLPTDLVAMTHEALDSLGPVAQSRVQVHAPEDLPKLRADARMLRYALLNLVDNALKYSPPDCPVVVDMAVASDAAGTPGLRWCVRDQGIGIREVDAERVFDKYFRAGETAQIAGMGLGLYLVRQIVSRHRGTVRVLPVHDQRGACIECWLPLGASSPR